MRLHRAILIRPRSIGSLLEGVTDRSEFLAGQASHHGCAILTTPIYLVCRYDRRIPITLMDVVVKIAGCLTGVADGILGSIIVRGHVSHIHAVKDRVLAEHARTDNSILRWQFSLLSTVTALGDGDLARLST